MVDAVETNRTMAHSATLLKKFNLSNTVEAVLSNGQFSRGFIPDVSGVIRLVGADHDDSVGVLVPVIGGEIYWISCRLFRSNGTVGVNHVIGVGGE